MILDQARQVLDRAGLYALFELLPYFGIALFNVSAGVYQEVPWPFWPLSSGISCLFSVINLLKIFFGISYVCKAKRVCSGESCAPLFNPSSAIDAAFQYFLISS